LLKLIFNLLEKLLAFPGLFLFQTRYVFLGGGKTKNSK